MRLQKMKNLLRAKETITTVRRQYGWMAGLGSQGKGRAHAGDIGIGRKTKT
jgi:hypothetical protein